MTPSRTRAGIGAIAVVLILIVASRLAPARAEDPPAGTAALSGKYVRVSFSPFQSRDGAVTDILGTVTSMDAIGLHMQTETFVYQRADDLKQVETILVPWHTVFYVTVLPKPQ